MMNELKFRAWHKFTKNYHEVIAINFAYENISIIDDDNIKMVLSLDDFVLEQYTGLKDNNGKEIYVGDIIDINQTVNGYNLFVITFENGLINVRYAHDMSQYEYDILELLDWDQLSLIETENEVVGNIHENKELL